MATAIIDRITTRYEVVGSGPQIEADLAAELVGFRVAGRKHLEAGFFGEAGVGTKSRVTP
jgi:hypothetical protein